MHTITFQVYRTVVVDGVATGNSELVEISIQDIDDSNSINREEWAAYTGNPNGHIGGTVDGVAVPALWDSTGGATNNTADGILYTESPITAGTNVVPILSNIVHAPKYDIDIADLAVCFVAGTLIATPQGQKPVESLRPGDIVLTRDNGPQPLVWVGHSHVGAEQLDRSPNLRPIRIKAGALGDGLPRRNVSVSAQHRVLVTDGDGQEFLVAARHLQSAGAPGFVVVRDGKPFTLVHIACACHEIIEAEGAAMETFFTGEMAVRALSAAERQSLLDVFPGLEVGHNPMTPARPFVKKKDVAAMLGRKEKIVS